MGAECDARGLHFAPSGLRANCGPHGVNSGVPTGFLDHRNTWSWRCAPPLYEPHPAARRPQRPRSLLDLESLCCSRLGRGRATLLLAGLALVPHGLRMAFGFFPGTGGPIKNLSMMAEALGSRRAIGRILGAAHCSDPVESQAFWPWPVHRRRLRYRSFSLLLVSNVRHGGSAASSGMPDGTLMWTCRAANPQCAAAGLITTAMSSDVRFSELMNFRRNPSQRSRCRPFWDIFAPSSCLVLMFTVDT